MAKENKQIACTQLNRAVKKEAKKLNVPKKFMLMGRQFEVVPIDQSMAGILPIDYHGLCVPDLNEIHVSTDIPRSKLEATYLHELVHAVLSCMGDTELYANEQFIDIFSGLLHQALTSGEGSI